MCEQSLVKTGRLTQRLQTIPTARGLGGGQDVTKPPLEKEDAKCHEGTDGRKAIIERITQLLKQANPYELKIILQFVLRIIK